MPDIEDVLEDAQREIKSIGDNVKSLKDNMEKNLADVRKIAEDAKAFAGSEQFKKDTKALTAGVLEKHDAIALKVKALTESAAACGVRGIVRSMPLSSSRAFLKSRRRSRRGGCPSNMRRSSRRAQSVLTQRCRRASRSPSFPQPSHPALQLTPGYDPRDLLGAAAAEPKRHEPARPCVETA